MMVDFGVLVMVNLANYEGEIEDSKKMWSVRNVSSCGINVFSRYSNKIPFILIGECDHCADNLGQDRARHLQVQTPLSRSLCHQV